MFKAIAVKEETMEDFVIYRPKDMLYAHARCGALPVLLFGNGGCSDTSVGYERMLSEVASHGYIVVAIGEMRDSLNERPIGQTESLELMRGLDLIMQKNRTKGTEYYNMVDSAKIAAAGHSCGGAQVLYNAGDPRLKTYLILNAGMGDMEMAGASRGSLHRLHAPILYIVGGPSDVAYENAQKDYARISHVPVCLANHPASGHGGTYYDKYGGDYGRLVLDWLDWHLKDRQDNAKIFLAEKPTGNDGWELKNKNFIDFKNVSSLWIENGDRQIYGVLNRPIGKEGRMPIAIVTSSDRKKMQALYSQHPEFPTLFDQIVTGDMVTKAKPDPECFLMGAQLIGVDIKDCIVFEDSRNGLIAGRASGARVIGVATTLSTDAVDELSDMTINAVSELTVEQMLTTPRKVK